MKTTLITALMMLSSSYFNFSFATEVLNETRNVNPFYGIIVNANANVIVCQGEISSVRLIGDKNNVNEVLTSVINGALSITGNNSKPIDIYITVAELNLVEVNGTARIYGVGPLNCDIVLLKASGNGSIRIDVRALTVGMIVKGNGKIIASGSTGNSFTKINGNGMVYDSNLDALTATKYENELAQDQNSKQNKFRFYPN